MDKQIRLIGLTKKQVPRKLRGRFNFYPNNQWAYVVKKSRWGQTRKLFIEFDENDTVIAQYTLNTYEK
ncbi:MAG: hypothetical protein QM564_09045 [Bergeyella sp.]